MKSSILKWATLSGILLCTWPGATRAASPSGDVIEGVTPVVISQAEQEELQMFKTNKATRLKRAIDQARSAYDDGILTSYNEERIKVYLDAISHIIPSQDPDLQKENNLIMRIALHQGVYLESRLKNESWFSAKPREYSLLSFMELAIKYYQTDIDLFEGKTTLDSQYMQYAMDFVDYVLNYGSRFEFPRSDAARFYGETAQLLKNILLAKGNRFRLQYAEILGTVDDIIEKMKPDNTVMNTNRKKTAYASRLLWDVKQQLQAIWTNHLRQTAERSGSVHTLYDFRAGHEYKDYAMYLVSRSTWRHTEDLDRAVFDFRWTWRDSYQNKTNTITGRATLVCSSQPYVRSGLYLDSHEGGKTPRILFNKLSDCYSLMRSSSAEGPVLVEEPHRPTVIFFDSPGHYKSREFVDSPNR